MFVKIVLFTVICMLLAYIAGSAVWVLIRDKMTIRDTFARRMSAGFSGIMAMSAIIYAISGFISLSVGYSLMVILALIITVVAVALFYTLKKHKNNLSDESVTDKSSINKAELIAAAINIVLIVLQILVVIRYSYVQVEATRLIPVATKVYDSGVCVNGSPVMNLWGAVAYLMGIHPMVLLYTLLPVSMLIFYYSGYYSLLLTINSEKRQTALLSLIIIGILNIWGFQSERLIPYTLLFSWFTGGCIVVHALLPLVFTILIGMKRRCSLVRRTDIAGKSDTGQDGMDVTIAENIDGDIEDDEYYEEEWDMKKHRIINARNLAIAIGFVAIALVGFVFVLNSKINTLHAATANLQKDLDSRCAMYEFTAESGEVKGYLLKGSDGSMTMVGGGSAEDAIALGNFLNNHGTELTNWYLYGTDEANMGAYDKCIKEQGISVKNVYVLYTAQMEK